MRKIAMIGVVAALGVLAPALAGGKTGVAEACPVGGDGIRPNPRPIQNVSFQASELIERAMRLESEAAAREQSARALAEQAELLQSRARRLREQLVFVNVADRPGLMSAAEELSLRAADDRAEAMRERSEASELRMQARSMRDRAAQLVRINNGNGGGWRKRPVEVRGGSDAVFTL
jgi:hypothetical protein